MKGTRELVASAGRLVGAVEQLLNGGAQFGNLLRESGVFFLLREEFESQGSGLIDRLLSGNLFVFGVLCDVQGFVMRVFRVNFPAVALGELLGFFLLVLNENVGSVGFVQESGVVPGDVVQ